MEERIRRLGRTAWWFVGICLALAIVAGIVWFFRVIIPPLVLAGVIVFLLNPIVTMLHRRGLPRVFGTAVAYLAFTFGVIGLALLLTPLIRSQADEFSDKWPEIRQDLEDGLEDLHDRSIEDDWPVTIPRIEDLDNDNEERKLSDQVATVREVGTRVFHIGLIFLLGPIIAFYLLVDLPEVRRRAEEMVPEASKDEVLFLAHRLNQVLGGFFRGQLAVAVIVGVLVSIGLLAIDLPLWLLIGMVAGLFNMIPLIGPYIGAVPAIVVALVTRDVRTAFLVVLVMVVAQQIDNHVITPTVMKRAVQLHPAAVMMALLAFGTVGGMFGLLLAVPVTAVVKVVGGHLWRKYVMGVSRPGLDHPAPDEPPPGAIEDEPPPGPGLDTPLTAR